MEHPAGMLLFFCILLSASYDSTKADISFDTVENIEEDLSNSPRYYTG